MNYALDIPLATQPEEYLLTYELRLGYYWITTKLGSALTSIQSSIKNAFFKT